MSRHRARHTEFPYVGEYVEDLTLELNVETKVEAGAPHETAPRERFVQVAAKEVRAAGVLFVGKAIHDLTPAQVRTIDCGARMLPEFPRQRPVPGERVPTPREVLDLAKTRAEVRLKHSRRRSARWRATRRTTGTSRASWCGRWAAGPAG